MKILHALFASVCLATPLLSAAAQNGQVVGVGGTSALGDTTGWHSSIIGAGSIGVTTANPRAGWAGYSSGSLEMHVTDGVAANGQYPDWAFWYRYAGGSAGSTIDAGLSFGRLNALSTMNFDWFRSELPGWDAPAGSVTNANGQPIAPIDWVYKTPVVRLQLREQRAGRADVMSELIWEGYYNQCTLGPSVACAANVTPVDQWVSQQNLQRDNFWYIHQPGVDEGAAYGLNSGCGETMSFWAGGIAASNAAGLFSSAGCLFGANVDVIGIAVGLGSQWPLEYHGYVDNVQLGFTDQNGLALDANFDFVPSTVPEPSTYALMIAGLFGIGTANRWRRNRGNGKSNVT